MSARAEGVRLYDNIAFFCTRCQTFEPGDWDGVTNCAQCNCPRDAHRMATVIEVAR